MCPCARHNNLSNLTTQSIHANNININRYSTGLAAVSEKRKLKIAKHAQL